MFLGCRCEANRPITLPSNWQSPVINFALLSAHVSSSPLPLSLCRPSVQSCGSPADISSPRLSAPLSPETMDSQKRSGPRGEDGETERGDNKEGKKKI